jgi:hypothetical protein
MNKLKITITLTATIDLDPNNYPHHMRTTDFMIEEEFRNFYHTPELIFDIENRQTSLTLTHIKEENSDA